MAQQSGLIAACLLDRKGGGTPLSWDQVEAWYPKQGLLWVHLDYGDDQASAWLQQQSGLDHLTVAVLLADETRPRCAISDNGLLLCLRGINLNPGQDPEDMVSIRLWLDADRIITTRKRRVLSVEDLRRSIDVGLGPKTSSEFVLMLNQLLLGRMAEVLDTIDVNLDALEQEVLTQESHMLRPRLSDIRRQIISIRRYLAPQREALYQLSIEKTTLFSDRDRLHIREINDHVVRYIEDLDAAREHALVTQEELSSRLSEQMEKRMYVLALVAVVFLPLTFITGLLGINVGGIPGSRYPWGFAAVCLFLLLLTLGMLIYLRGKKWL